MHRPSPVTADPVDAARPRGPSRLHRALDALMEAFWLLDAVRDAAGRITDFAIVELNLSAACMSGLDPAGARGRLLGEAVPLVRELGHIERFAEVVASGRPAILQFGAESAEGRTVWRRVHAVRSGDGVVVTVTDLTDRDMAERALAEAEHAALHRVSEAVAENVDEEQLYALVAGEIARLLGADGGRVVRYLEEGVAEVLGAWRRPSLPPTLPGERLVLSPTWAITRARETAATAVAELSAEAAARAGAHLRMGIAAPVRSEGRVWGAVAAAFRDPRDVPQGAAARVERFAKLVGLAVANAEARGRLTRQATTDALTGLANHGAFHTALADAWARADRYGGELSLAVVDLDHFKRLNDSFGHQAGDAALAAVGGILRDLAREADVVGRIGGEEIGWLMPETTIAGAAEAAGRLRRAIAAAPVCGPMGLTASVGLARRIAPDADAGALFRRADAALYRAKQGGRDRVVADRG